MDTEVQIGSWSSVLPLIPVENKVVPLSPLDNYFAYPAYQKRLLFFPRKGNEATQVLKDSLSKALVYFYPFSGRISYKSNNVQLQLHLNVNSGARFVEATTTATIADLGSEILPSEFTDKLAQMEVFPAYPWREEYPLLSVQATTFACGGLSLGVSFSHQVCDGVGFWHFMNSWGEIARLGQPLVAPEMEYSIVEADSSPNKNVHEELPLRMVLLRREDVLQAIRRTGWKKLDDGLSSTMVKLDKEKIIMLKSSAAGCSTFAITCAYLWKRLAMTWESGSSQQAQLVFLINCRGKTSWISSNYFGNAVLGTFVATTVDQLQKDSLMMIAELIQQTITESCRRDCLEAGIRALHRHDDDEEFLPFPGTDRGAKSAMIVGSPRHRTYEVDFGWGRACGSTFGAQDLGPNKIFLFPSAQGGVGINATVALDEGTMQQFLQQQA